MRTFLSENTLDKEHERKCKEIARRAVIIIAVLFVFSAWVTYVFLEWPRSF
jgi:hypothetical protein